MGVVWVALPPACNPGTHRHSFTSSFPLTKTLSIATLKQFIHTPSFATCRIPAQHNIAHGSPPPQEVKPHSVLHHLPHHCSPRQCPWPAPLPIQAQPAPHQLHHSCSPRYGPPDLITPKHSSCSPRHCPWPPPPRAWARSGSWCCRCPAAHSRWCPRCTPIQAKGTKRTAQVRLRGRGNERQGPPGVHYNRQRGLRNRD